MDFTFVKGDSVAFFRSDAQQAEWTQEELNLHCVFPFLPDKVIERGTTILFQDPATWDWQAYEVRQCQAFTDYQQIEAEDLAVSELTDCHVPGQVELTNVSASNALSQLLSGTGWNVGTVGSNPVSSGDFSRGSVWQNVSEIVTNWNVRILPRVTVDASGITGRFLDIISPIGTDRGLRLAVNKNVTDPCVTYDDTDLYTALYGYGGTYSEGTLEDRKTLEYNFADVVWSKTAGHPAKPKGQKYLEYPEMTALYGRNGKPRFGYYQNTNIKDPAILLQKTWETLKTCCQPKISIDGTVTDLKRLGYDDVPVRLYDLAIVEIEPIGVQIYKQVIKLTVDLLDPTKNLPTIGDYIPNIIYINRETESFATGGGKGSGKGGGGGGRTKVEVKESEYDTQFYDTGQQIGIYARKTDKNGNILEQAGMDIDPSTGVLIYAEGKDNMIGSMFHVQKDMIEAEVHNRTTEGLELSSKISQTADAISLEVSQRKQEDKYLSGRIDVQADKVSLVVEEKNGQNVVKASSIVAGINAQTGSYVRIKADTVNLDGYVTMSRFSSLEGEVDNLVTGSTTAVALRCASFYASYIQLNGAYITRQNVEIGGVTYRLVGW